MKNYDYELERLRAIVEKGSKIESDDRAFILMLADELGVTFDPSKKRCKSCWLDAAVECSKKIKEMQGTEQVPDGRKYVLKTGVDVYFGSARVNSGTLTDELAERLLKRGFDKRFFEKCE